MRYAKKNLLVILVILLTLLLIAVVIWVFDKRIEAVEKKNATAKIQLIDITGKAVQTENAEINYGALQKTINVSSALRKGIYMVRIIVNSKGYKTQLIYEK